ncbi:MAG: hypothetical protein PF542_04315 [Nanoarchaeota archaeon]|jgi:hypothetical protein|nr:hypothetical protein [Nanoarchaeota archaeon]
MNRFIEEKEGKAKVVNRVSYIFWTLIVLVLIAIVLVLFPSGSNTKRLGCGDETFYDTCSLNKPYYCTVDGLVRDPVVCGCPEVMDKREGECVSEAFGPVIEKSFRYILRGEEEFLAIPLYNDFMTYLDTQPRTLFYESGEIPRRDDFKLMKMDNPLQRETLIPLLVAIQNAAPDSVEDQARIAISMVQQLRYSEPESKSSFLGVELRLARYPYQVLYEETGSCEGKSELLAFLLREMGYDVALFYYGPESHEAVGIKCPMEYSLDNTGYCFVETTVPAPISYSTGIYLGLAGGKLYSTPTPILLGHGIAFDENAYEYADAKKLDSILSSKGDDGMIPFYQKKALDELRGKYGLAY